MTKGHFMKNKSIFIGLAVLLSACGADKAIVTGFNGDSVEIQTSQFGGSAASANAQKEANRLCKMRNFLGAEYASTRQDNYNYVNHNLYICTNTRQATERQGGMPPL
jgi:hypothetical protein